MSGDYYLWNNGYEELIQIMKWQDKKPVEKHKHEFIEIVFIARGSCKHKYRDSIVTLIPGDTFVIVPNEEHEYTIDKDMTIYNILFYPEFLGSDWNSLCEIGGIYDLLFVEPFYRSEAAKQEILHLEPEVSGKLEKMLDEMREEKNAMKIGSKLNLKAGLIKILVLLAREWESSTGIQARIMEGKRNLLVSAINFIEQNMKEALTVGQIASKAYMSPQHFRKIFKNSTGVTPMEYINKLRISTAQKLLIESDFSISKIAEEIGIIDINYFSRLFKREVGCSPSTYRTSGRNS